MKFIISENPGAEWDHFVARHTGILFYYSAWSEVLNKGLGGQPCYMYLAAADGIVCGMSAIILKYYGIKLLYSSIPYGGYLGPADLFDSFMKQVVARAKTADVLYIAPYAQGGELDYLHHFKSNAEIATRIDLQGRRLEEVQSCFEPSVRQSINKGRRLGLEVRRANDRESFLAAHCLYLQTMRRNRAIARYAQNWFAALHDILAGQGRAFVYLAYHNGEPVSATVVVNSESGYHLLHSGSSAEHLQLRANDLVVCEIIKDAIAEGKGYVDLMLSDSLDKPLIRWKEKFGGSSIVLNKYRKVNSPLKYALWNRAKSLYPLVRSLTETASSGLR